MVLLACCVLRALHRRRLVGHQRHRAAATDAAASEPAPAHAFARSVNAMVCEPCARRTSEVAFALYSAMSGGCALARRARHSSSIAVESGRPDGLRKARMAPSVRPCRLSEPSALPT
jgi:hypothetical protein